MSALGEGAPSLKVAHFQGRFGFGVWISKLLKFEGFIHLQNWGYGDPLTNGQKVYIFTVKTCTLREVFDFCPDGVKMAIFRGGRERPFLGNLQTFSLISGYFSSFLLDIWEV